MEVALYARVFSDGPDLDLSILAQLKALRDYAARNNHQVEGHPPFKWRICKPILVDNGLGDEEEV